MLGIKESSSPRTAITIPDNSLNDKFKEFCRMETLTLGFGELYRNAPGFAPDDMIRDYLNRHTYEAGLGLRLTGPAGSGKTTSLAMIAYHIIKSAGIYGIKGQPEMADYWSSPLKGQIVYLHPEKIFSELCYHKGSQLVENIKLYSSAKYLLIDDIDHLENDEHLPYRLGNILSRRYANNLTTFVTSVCSLEMLQLGCNFDSIKRSLMEITLPVNLETRNPQAELNLH